MLHFRLTEDLYVIINTGSIWCDSELVGETCSARLGSNTWSTTLYMINVGTPSKRMFDQSLLSTSTCIKHHEVLFGHHMALLAQQKVCNSAVFGANFGWPCNYHATSSGFNSPAPSVLLN